MKHIFKQGKDSTAPTLVLLHGTGGDENDLMPLASFIHSEASVLSVRGNIVENGMPRFFERLSPGVFDEASLKKETKNLYEFLNEAAEKYGLDRKNMVAVGYSNGANIAGSLLFHYADALRGALLHHPMVPLRGLELPDLSSIPIFIGAGENDPICPSEESKELKKMFENAGAIVSINWQQSGHSLTQKELEAAADFYTEQFR